MATKTTTTKYQTKPKDYTKKKASAVNKQVLSTPERLRRLFTSLCAQIDGGHFVNAVRTCDKILHISPTDTDAHKTKLFLLLQTEQYDAALRLLSPHSRADHAFEHAYVLYRLQREDEARVVLGDVKAGRERAKAHLEAQMSYRSGSYSQAVELYTQLLETAEPNTEEHTDILTNLHAAQLHLDFTTTGYKHALDLLPKSLTASILQSAPPPPPPSSSSSASAASYSHKLGAPAKEKETEGENANAKKPRRSRIPPGVVPGLTPPPDPERWLKKSERAASSASAFGGGSAGRRRKGGAGGATQGSANVGAGAGGESGVGEKEKERGVGMGKGKRRR